MDLVILVVFLLIVAFYFRSFESFVYFMAIVDILLRILSFIASQFGTYIPDIAEFITSNIPANIPSIINAYSTDIFNTLLMLGYLIVFILFEFYMIKYFFKKRR